MDKPKQPISKPIYRPPPRPISTAVFAEHIEEKKPEAGLIDKLFLLIEEGNMAKITDYINSNNISLSNVNEFGQSVLHTIIENRSLIDSDKISLVNFAITRGAPVMVYDTNNVTPLHLACKFQLKEIIEILLQKGAELNVQDNSGMSPLHYLVSGNSTICQKASELKPKKIVKPEKSAGSDKLIIGLTHDISELITHDKHANQYFQHIRNSILSSNEIFRDKINEMNNQTNIELGRKLSDIDTSNEQKLSQVSDYFIQLKNKYNDTVINELKNSLEKTTTHPNIVDGWGPTSSNAKNNILRMDNIKTAQNIFKAKKIELNISVNQLAENINALDDFINANFEINLKNLEISLSKILWLNWGVFLNESSSSGKVYHVDLNEINKSLYSDANLLFNLNIDEITNQDDLLSGNFNECLFNNLPENKPMPRLTPNELKKLKQPPVELQITLDTGLTANQIHNGNPQAGVAIVGNNLYQINNALAAQKLIASTNNNNLLLTVLSPALYYEQQIKAQLGYIRTNYNVIGNNIALDHFYAIYAFVLPLLQTNILNILINSLALLKFALKTPYNSINNLKNLFYEKYTNNPSNKHNFYLEMAWSECDNSMKIMKNIDSSFDKLYTSLNNVNMSCNNVIKNLNDYMGLTYISIYNNDFESNFISDEETDIFKQIFTHQMGNIPKLDSIKYYLELVNNFDVNSADDVKTQKQNFYEKYFPQITNNNYTSYLYDNVITSISEGESVEFLNIQFNKRGAFSSGLVPDAHGSVKPQIGYYYEGYSFDGITNEKPIFKEGIVSSNLNNLLDGNDSHIGLVGYINSNLSYNKSEKCFPVLSTMFDEHLVILRLNIIQYVITYVANNLAALNNIKKYDNFLRENLTMDNDDFGLLYTVIVKVIDNIFISFIQKNIQEFSTQYAITRLKLKLNTNVPDYNEILKTVNTSFQNLLINEKSDYGFELGLHEISKEIFNLTGTNEDIHLLKYASPLIKSKPDELKNMYVVYNYLNSSQLLDTQCYKINSGLLDVINKYKYDVNLKNNDGNSAIFLALELRNKDSVKKLIDNGSTVFIKSSENKLGMTPLSYGLELYKAHLNIFSAGNTIIKNLTENIYEKIKLKIKSNPAFKNNILEYSEIILPMFIILINYYFFINVKKYKHGLKYEQLIQIAKDLGSNDINIGIPLINVNENDLVEAGVSNTSLIKLFADEETKKINEDEISISMYGNMAINLQKELSTLDSRNINHKRRIDEINKELASISLEINNKKNKVSHDKNYVIELKNAKSTLEKPVIRNIKQRINGSWELQSNVNKLYNFIAINIINNSSAYEPNLNSHLDLRTYSELWRMYISDQKKLHNITNIHPYLISYQLTLLNDYIPNKNHTDYKNKILLISEVHKNILLPLCRDYAELSGEYYNEEINYVLKQIMDIMCHVLKFTLFASLYHLISRAVFNYIKETNKRDSRVYRTDADYARYISSMTDKIINTGNNGSDLLNYILNKMPMKMIKTLLNVYTDDFDPDKNETLDTVYAKISEIIIKNKVTVINSTSSLIRAIDGSIKDLFIEYIKLFVGEMKNLTDGYFKYIINETKYIEIISLLIDKSIKE